MRYAAILIVALVACGKKEEKDKRFPDPTDPYVVPNTYDEAYLEIERMTRDAAYYIEHSDLPKVKEQIEPLKQVAAKLPELAKAKSLTIDEQTFVGDIAPQLTKAVGQLEAGANASDPAQMKQAIGDIERWSADLKKCYGHRH